MDARVIDVIATGSRAHLAPLVLDHGDWPARRAALNATYARARDNDAKADLTAAARMVLPASTNLDEVTRRVLGDGRDYAPTLLAAVQFAAVHCAIRAEMERLLGQHASAYPTMPRSEVHHHVVRHARARGVTWQQFRPAVRALYRTLRHAAVAAAHPT